VCSIDEATGVKIEGAVARGERGREQEESWKEIDRFARGG